MSATVYFTSPLDVLDFQAKVTLPKAEFTKCGRWLKVPGKDGATVHVPSSMCVVVSKEPMR